jgi:hypothetical protein
MELGLQAHSPFFTFTSHFGFQETHIFNSDGSTFIPFPSFPNTAGRSDQLDPEQPRGDQSGGSPQGGAWRFSPKPPMVWGGPNHAKATIERHSLVGYNGLYNPTI